MICTRCVLPEGFPGINFDENTICNFCRSHDGRKHGGQFDQKQRDDFDRIVSSSRGASHFDALCCYSGGKDSSYMLLWMKRELGLRVLAFTLDNGFIAREAKENISRMTDALDVAHLYIKPSPAFMQALYREAMSGKLNEGKRNYQTRISDTCLGCISVVNSTAARLALEKRIPMIFAGFTPGQIPRAVIKNNHVFYRQSFEERRDHLRELLGDSAEYYMSVPSIDDWDIYQMSPFLVYERSEAEILEAIRSIGWIAPEKLDGCTSNCSLNALGNACHQKRYGFHPYAQELSILIRKGLLEREEALAKLANSGEASVVAGAAERLGIPTTSFTQGTA